jgi:hypothetical protein
MVVYPSFIYLQNQKTGCTFVRECLKRFCSEAIVYTKAHATLAAAPGKFCFTNVREPLALYRSLFAYGLDGKGTVYLRLTRSGRGELYRHNAAGFLPWLDVVTRPENALLLADDYTPEIARLLGFMSWRFLRLACPGFEKAAHTFQDAHALASYVKSHYVLGAVLHQERLREELKSLLTGRLAAYFPDQAGLISWLEGMNNINASRSSVHEVAVDENLRMRVLQREAILYRNFYPDALTRPTAGEPQATPR